ncbi:uncharacterized protein LOC135464956 [Liolophura sinensis]|uniref:uncharacterized protein LOC135464956 n=1 Tax=Liolophura sinensis TaxID=3198878 RepID=UPI003158FF85
MATPSQPRQITTGFGLEGIVIAHKTSGATERTLPSTTKPVVSATSRREDVSAPVTSFTDIYQVTEDEGTVALQTGEIKQELQTTPGIVFRTGDIQPVKTTTTLLSRQRTTISVDRGQPDAFSTDRVQPDITASTSDLVRESTVKEVITEGEGKVEQEVLTEQTTRGRPQLFTTEGVKEPRKPVRVTADMIPERVTTDDRPERFTEDGKPSTAGKLDRVKVKFTTTRQPEAVTTQRKSERVTPETRLVTSDVRPDEVRTDGRPERITTDGQPENVTAFVHSITKEETLETVSPKAGTAEPTTPSFGPRQLFKSRRDIVFVLDSSSYVSESEFSKSREYVKLLLQPADIDGGNVRVSVITYSTKSSTQFDLSRYSTKSQIFGAIDRIAYTPGSSSLASALRGIRRDIFPNGKGNRANVPDVAVLVVGSVSDTKKKWVEPAAKAIKRRGVSVYGVSARLQDTTEIRNIVSEPASDSVFSVDRFEELHKTRISLTQKIFGETVVEWTSPRITPEQTVAPAKESPDSTFTPVEDDVTTSYDLLPDHVSTDAALRLSKTEEPLQRITTERTPERLTQEEIPVRVTTEGRRVTSDGWTDRLTKEGKLKPIPTLSTTEGVTPDGLPDRLTKEYRRKPIITASTREGVTPDGLPDRLTKEYRRKPISTESTTEGLTPDGLPDRLTKEDTRRPIPTSYTTEGVTPDGMPDRLTKDDRSRPIPTSYTTEGVTPGRLPDRLTKEDRLKPIPTESITEGVAPDSLPDRLTKEDRRKPIQRSLQQKALLQTVCQIDLLNLTKRSQQQKALLQTACRID